MAGALRGLPGRGSRGRTFSFFFGSSPVRGKDGPWISRCFLETDVPPNRQERGEADPRVSVIHPTESGSTDFDGARSVGPWTLRRR